ncbi:MAG: ABC transporter permease [bacterium]|nr:ABC transporter permease [bacterium]
MFWYLVKTLKETFTNRKVMVCSLGILCILFGSVVYFNQTAKSDNKGQRQVPAESFGVVDYDQSIYSTMIIGYFKEAGSFQKFASFQKGSEEEVHAKFLNGEISAYLIIPEGFSKSLMNGSATKIKTMINTNNTVVSVMLSNMLDSYDTYITNVQKNSFALYELFKATGIEEKELDKINFNTSIELVKQALAREDLFEKHEVTTMPHTPIYKYYIWAVISLIILYSAVISGFSLLREVSLGTFARLQIIGHSMASVLTAIILTNTFLWSLLTCSVTKIICNMMHSTFPLKGFIFLVLCIFAANTFFCLLASIFQDKKTYMIVSNLGLLCMGILGGVVYPISVMPYRFVKLAKVSPNYHIIFNCIQYSNENNGGPAVTTMVITLVLITLLSYLLALIAIRRTRQIQIGGEYENN